MNKSPKKPAAKKKGALSGALVPAPKAAASTSSAPSGVIGQVAGGNDPLLPVQRVWLDKQSRFNPIRNLTPQVLNRYLEQFDYGDLRYAALLWDKMERCDDVLKAVAPKRKKAVARREWEILALDDSPEAAAQKETLEAFYNNLTCTSAVDLNIRGGFRLLVEQMLDSVGKRYAVHHIVWKPSPDGITAQFFFVPLWFFENRTGQLRFLPDEFAYAGQPMEPGEWLVTYGDGLMEASSIAYMFKHLPMKDWLIYSERHGMPFFQGKTASAYGSDAWNAMVEAVRAIGVDFSCVTSLTDAIEKIETSAQGELPYPKLVERCDRAMSSLWLGSDLSTMSGHGSSGRTGASVQKDQAELLEDDDCRLISDTLHEQVDKNVLRYQHGTDRPLARINIPGPNQQDVALDLQIDAFLTDIGLPQSFDQMYQRYGRTAPEGTDGKALVHAAAPVAVPPDPALNERRGPAPAGQQTFLSRARARLASVQPAALAPVHAAIKEVLAGNDEELPARLEELKKKLPTLLKQISSNPATVQAWAEIIGTGLVNGLTAKNP